MASISTTKAVELVRLRLDELDPNGSVMFTDENGDNRSLDKTIGDLLPEVIDEVSLAAPTELLEAKAVNNTHDCSVTDGVLSFTLDENFLRLVSFQAKDTPEKVSELIEENSPEARKQLNKTIRGTFDRPKLVKCLERQDAPRFKYYSLSPDTEVPEEVVFDDLATMCIMESQECRRTNVYDISKPLVQYVIERLAGEVLSTFGEPEKAKYFFEKSKIG